MTLQKPPLAAYSFGPFDVDPQTEELKKQGVRLRLPRQSFQVLLMLLERPGRLVPRDELQQALWPSDTFVDFEKGLNAAVNRLRETLGDSAEDPRYVETLPRRGYRFIAPLERCGARIAIPEPPKALGRTSLLTGTKAWVLLVSLVCALALAVILVWVKLPSSPSMPSVVDSVQITKDGLPKATPMLVSDGTRLFFQEGKWNVEELKTTLMQASTRGGETAPIVSSLRNPIVFDFSRVRTELLVGGGGVDPLNHTLPLWVLPLPAGPPHRLGDIVARDACWAPNGRRLAFTRGKDVFVVEADGTAVRKLASADGFDDAFWVRFSPDGKRLRFSAVKWGVHDPKREIFEMAADGSGLHPVPLHGGCCGVWSADGEYYFYQKDRDIWVLPERRSLFGKVKLGAPVQLTFGPIRYSALAVGGDRNELFVVGEQSRVELVHYEPVSKRWVPFLGGISAEELQVSPDGQWVTYTTFPEGNLWRSRLDGSERLQLTLAPINAHEPRWSPDGKQILFTDFPYKIFIVSADGGIPRQLLPADHPDSIGAGAWLPDGHTIIFGRHMGCSGIDNPCWAIFQLDLRTQSVKKIPGSDGMLGTRVSPDGRYLTAGPAGGNKLMLYDLRTRRWSELIEGRGSIAWSRNSRSVYVVLQHQSKPPELIRISIPDGKVQRLLDLKDVTLGGYWPGWISLLPDDSPLFMLDRSIEEIYRLDLRYR
jgi:DNA-binding winged helix-turn-helix (wHTH) protein/Tol biopolymer transport system component